MDQQDTDGDGIGDVCDPCPFDGDNDADHDGVCGYTLAQWPPDTSLGLVLGVDIDNCPNLHNPRLAGSQPDFDGDAQDPDTFDPRSPDPLKGGDACDQDADGDTHIAIAYGGDDYDDLDPSVWSETQYPIVFTFTDNASTNPQSYEDWLPTDSGSVTVTVYHPSGKNITSFYVKSVSNLPGRYTNDSNTDTNYDFYCGDTGITYCTPNMPIAEAQIILRSLDYGASITLHAKASDGSSRDYTIPKGPEGSRKLPDQWKAIYGNLDPEADNDGDGLKNFDEYRGFKWGKFVPVQGNCALPAGGGSGTTCFDNFGCASNEICLPYQTRGFTPEGSVSHIRTDSTRKDLFVKYKDYTTSYPFAIGSAFFDAGIDVWVIDYNTASTLGDRYIKPLLVTHWTGSDPASGRNGNIYKRGIRNFTWDNKGDSPPGSYGANTYQLALSNYFKQKPYINKACTSCTNGLDPLTIVEDVDDNGAKKFVSPCQTGKDCDRNTNGVLDGDYYAKNGSFNNNLTMFDINNNKYVELPFRTNPVGIDRKYEFSEKQVLKHTITHEMGHAVGVPASHTTESDCLMFNSSNNWKRDNKFGTAAKSYIINGITNKNGNP
jgi:hypothetical protein